MVYWPILTCAQKLTSSQLSLPHGTKQKRIMKKLKHKTEKNVALPTKAATDQPPERSLAATSKNPKSRTLRIVRSDVKVKVKVGFLYSATCMVDQEQRALAISEVAIDWQEPMVLQRRCGHPLPALTDIVPAVVASKHTTSPINHTRPSSRKHSPDVITPSEMAEPDYCLLLIYRPRKDERLSWPSRLTCSG